MTCVNDLLAISSTSEADGPPTLSVDCRRAAGVVGDQLEQLLQSRNGFYAFESALHVFPATENYMVVDLNRWNIDHCWRFTYDDLATGYVFFADDLFGGQFGIREEAIYHFNPETAETTWLASTLEQWADIVLGDYEFLTGYPLAHAWQQRHGSIPSGRRLIPRVPFVMGGSYEIGNLDARYAVSAMQAYGRLAQQIKHLPDGTPISLEWP